jgi:hypothetical protein
MSCQHCINPPKPPPHWHGLQPQLQPGHDPDQFCDGHDCCDTFGIRVTLLMLHLLI